MATRPAQINRSACRGLKRMASAPKRARSKRLAAVAMSSMPQHAVAKGSGHSEFFRHQLTPYRRKKSTRLSSRVVATSSAVIWCGA